MDPYSSHSLPEEPGDPTRTGLPAREAGAQPAVPPLSIGQYRVIRALGQGGQGVVYLAEQQQPRRTVAVKVMQTGWAGADLLHRFEREAHALGRLQHPGIAQIYEAGTADSGHGPQPYFAMEFIQGRRLLAFADAKSLSLRDRVELVIKIADAVSHAHQRGIIHRDLKPANILVDDGGQPKILDFGVARLIDTDAATTRGTETGQLVGTLAYMSPEQVLANPDELDPRSDVYAIGVILYELLTGRLPYAVDGPVHEAARTILEDDPAPLGAAGRQFRGDLETITAKALEKEKARRYGSAAALAEDLRRFLAHEPVLARPASAAYHLRKLVRRHTGLVAGVAVVFAVLIAGMVTTSSQAVRAGRAEGAAVVSRDQALAAERLAGQQRDRATAAEAIATSERNRAVDAEKTALTARDQAVVEKRRATDEAAAARAVNEFLLDDLLGQATPNNQARPGLDPNPDITVRTALDRAAARVSEKFSRQPLLEATIRQSIGDAYSELGLLPQAQQQEERALELRMRLLGPEHNDTLTTMNNLAIVYDQQANYVQAEALLTRAIEVRRRLNNNPDLVEEMHNLAKVYRAESKYDKGEPLLIEALDISRRIHGKDHTVTLSIMNELALLYRRLGRLSEAEPLFTSALEGRRRTLGETHPFTLDSLNNLGALFLSQGRYAQAEEAFAAVLKVRSSQSEEHPDTLTSMNNLAVVYGRQAKYDQAEPLARKVVDIQTRLLGPEHPSTLNSKNNLAVIYRNEKKLDQAEVLLTVVVDARRRVLGDQHADTLTSTNNLAIVYEGESKDALAEPLLVSVVDARRKLLGAQHPDTLDSLNWLGLALLHQQKYSKAEAAFRDALEGRQKTMADSWRRFNTESLLGAVLAGDKRYAEAEPLLKNGYQGMRDRESTIPAESRQLLDDARDRLAQLYKDWVRLRAIDSVAASRPTS